MCVVVCGWMWWCVDGRGGVWMGVWVVGVLGCRLVGGWLVLFLWLIGRLGACFLAVFVVRSWVLAVGLWLVGD